MAQIKLPAKDRITQNDGLTTSPWLEFFRNVNDSLQRLVATSGSSSTRPAKNLKVGMMYFDTSLGKPIFLYGMSETKSAVWVDALGNFV